jgi:hypothetical protein
VGDQLQVSCRSNHLIEVNQMGKIAGIVNVVDGQTLDRQYHNGPISIANNGTAMTIYLALGGADVSPVDTNQNEYYWITNADATASLTVKIIADRLPLFDLNAGAQVDHVDLAAGETGIFAQQLQQVPYITVLRSGGAGDLPPLPNATATQAGVVTVPANSGLSVNAGALALDPATATTLGGVKVSATGGITNNQGVIGVNVGMGLQISGDALAIEAATNAALGGVLVKNDGTGGISNVDGLITLLAASATEIGGVIVPAGSGLSVDGSGKLTYTGSGIAYELHKPFIPNESAYAASEVLWNEIFTTPINFAAGAGSSKFSAMANATAQTVFSIEKNGTAVGTVTYAAASKTGVVNFTAATSFAIGDVISLVAPATPDTTLVGVFGTLQGTHA